MDIYRLKEVERWASSVLRAMGMSPIDADFLVENLSFAESRGVAGHGYVRLPVYLQRIQNGGISAKAAPAVTSNFGALQVVDGMRAAGSSAMREAILQCSAAAEEYGVGMTLVHSTNHFGAIAHYSTLIADRGFVGIVAGNSDRLMAPPGGGKPVLGSNPLSIALPVTSDQRPVLDMATTASSFGKVLLAKQQDLSIPAGWAVDVLGDETTSPERALAGALLPAAGPKGFGLAFMIDAIVAAAGAETSPFVNQLYGESARGQRLGAFCIALRPAVSPESYATSIDRLVAAVRAAALPEGGTPPLYPGEPEANFSREFSDVIHLGFETSNALTEFGRDLSLPFPATDEE